MSKRDSEADFAELGRRDGDAAGRRAIAALPRSDARGRLGRAVERELAERSHRMAEMAEEGVPATAVYAYRQSWSEGLEAVFDRLAAQVVPLLPDDPADDEDEAGDDN